MQRCRKGRLHDGRDVTDETISDRFFLSAPLLNVANIASEKRVRENKCEKKERQKKKMLNEKGGDSRHLV